MRLLLVHRPTLGDDPAAGSSRCDKENFDVTIVGFSVAQSAILDFERLAEQLFGHPCKLLKQ